MTSPVRVGVNLVWLVPGVVGGSEEYTTRLLQGLAERAPSDLHVTLFVLEPFARAHPELVAAFPTVSCRLDGRSKPRPSPELARFTLFGLANLVLARRWLLAPDGQIAS